MDSQTPPSSHNKVTPNALNAPDAPNAPKKPELKFTHYDLSEAQKRLNF